MLGAGLYALAAADTFVRIPVDGPIGPGIDALGAQLFGHLDRVAGGAVTVAEASLDVRLAVGHQAPAVPQL